MKDVRKQYFGEKPINRDTLTQFVRLLDDVLFIYGIDKAAKVQANRSSGKTFYYQYVCVVIITICLHRSAHPSFMYSRFRRIPRILSLMIERRDWMTSSRYHLALFHIFLGNQILRRQIVYGWLFVFCFLCWALRHTQQNCRFSVELGLNFNRDIANASTFGLSGATHIEDMFYLFKYNASDLNINWNDAVKVKSRETRMIRAMCKFITNFAKNG